MLSVFFSIKFSPEKKNCGRFINEKYFSISITHQLFHSLLIQKNNVIFNLFIHSYPQTVAWLSWSCPWPWGSDIWPNLPKKLSMCSNPTFRAEDFSVKEKFRWKKLNGILTWARCYKTFYDRNLRNFEIS